MFIKHPKCLPWVFYRIKEFFRVFVLRSQTVYHQKEVEPTVLSNGNATIKTRECSGFINLKNNTKTFEEYRKRTRGNIGTVFKLTVNIY